MNTSYSSLRTVATVFNVLGWIQLIGGICLVFFFLAFAQNSYYEPGVVVAYIGGVALITFFSVVCCFAIAQFVKLCINVAGNVENINDNIYIIAKKAEKEMV